MNMLAPQEENVLNLVPKNGDKGRLSRLRQFERWLTDTGRSWITPDLGEYCDYLAKRLSPNSINSHLSTIRGRYKELLLDRDRFYALVPKEYSGDIVKQKTFVDEAIARLTNAINPLLSKVEVEIQQDEVGKIRLTPQQAATLMSLPDITTLTGLRDLAIIATGLAVGLRSFETAKLKVKDIDMIENGEIGVHVRLGKGRKTRFVPWGENIAALYYIRKWLEKSNIVDPDAYVFRGIYQGEYTIRETKISTVAIQKILKKYPIIINGNKTTLKTQDLRRTCARTWYTHDNMDLLAIMKNLGHSNAETTIGYIGDLDLNERAANKGLIFPDIDTA